MKTVQEFLIKRILQTNTNKDSRRNVRLAANEVAQRLTSAHRGDIDLVEKRVLTKQSKQSGGGLRSMHLHIMCSLQAQAVVVVQRNA